VSIIIPGLTASETADSLTARIARDFPDILERMKEGEFKSVRAAAMEAGIRKPTATIPLDPEGAARLIREHSQGDALATLVRLLTGYIL
jgi:hypothetical protein